MNLKHADWQVNHFPPSFSMTYFLSIELKSNTARVNFLKLSCIYIFKIILRGGLGEVGSSPS